MVNVTCKNCFHIRFGRYEVIIMREKKNLLIFVLVAIGVPFLMGIPMSIVHGKGIDVSIFGNAQMFYPAAGVILCYVIFNWKDGLLPKKFFISYLILTGMMMVCSFSLMFFDVMKVTTIFTIVISVGSIVVGICYLTEKKENRIAYHINGGHWKVSWLMIGLFVVLYTLRIIICCVIDGSIGTIVSRDTLPMQIAFFIALPFSFFSAFTAFFGEEYGWRGYLQPILMNRFGRRKGVLLLGIIWGLWHLPLDLFFYAPETPFLSVLGHQITCISLGIFFAYVYLKTENIWSVVLLHFLNNNLIPVFTGSANIANSVITIKDIVILFVVNFVIFLPFLLSNVFSKKTESGKEQIKVNI